jgi:hypothetical protein
MLREIDNVRFLFLTLQLDANGTHSSLPLIRHSGVNLGGYFVRRRKTLLFLRAYKTTYSADNGFFQSRH